MKATPQIDLGMGKPGYLELKKEKRVGDVWAELNNVRGLDGLVVGKVCAEETDRANKHLACLSNDTPVWLEESP